MPVAMRPAEISPSARTSIYVPEIIISGIKQSSKFVQGFFEINPTGSFVEGESKQAAVNPMRFAINWCAVRNNFSLIKRHRRCQMLLTLSVIPANQHGIHG